MRTFLRRGACLAASGMLALSGVSLVHAEEAEPGKPEVKYETEVTPKYWSYDVAIKVTIPEGFTDKIVPIYAFKDLEENDGVIVQPGDSVSYSIELVNHSGTVYHYANQSLDLTPSAQNLKEPKEQVFRAYNAALGALGLQSNKATELTDEKVGAALRTAGYGTDTELSDADVAVEYLDDYYLDYYNETFAPEAENVSSLQDVSSEYCLSIFKGKGDNFDRDTISNARETNEEVNKMSWTHAYKNLLTIDGVGVLDYSRDTEAYSGMENQVLSCVNNGNPITFGLKIDGPGTGNAYQVHRFSFPYNFTLVTDDVTQDEKTSEPDLEKKITDGDKIDIDENGDYATVDASGRVDFTLTSHVGEDLAEVIEVIPPVEPGTAPADLPLDQFKYGTYSFTFVDYLDEELTFDAESIALKVNGKDVTVSAGDVKTAVVAEGAYEGRTEIKVSVDLVELFKQGIFSYSEIGTAPIVLTYSAKVKDGNEVVPGKMYNTAWVEYQNKKTEPDDVDVDTFGLKIFKYDQTTNTGLKGAEFELYQMVAAEEGADPEKVVIAEKITSNSDGYAVINGLKAGTYYLKETKAPAGYNKSDEPLQIIVDQDHDDQYYYVTTNFANTPEVHTGGEGTTMFTVIGGLVILAGAAYVMITKKRRTA